MLLRRGPSELGRRLLQEWAARHAAVAASIIINTRTGESSQEFQAPPRFSDGAAGEDHTQNLAAAAASSTVAATSSGSHDLRRPYCFTVSEWNPSRDSLLPTQFGRQHYHLSFGRVLKPQHQHQHQQHQQQQQCGIATSATCNAEGVEEPVRSPLSQAPGPQLGIGGQKMGVSPTRTAQAVLTGIKQSPKKLNLVAEMVRGMRVEDALTQMAVSVKRAAKTVSKVMHSAQANAVHNFGLEKDRLVVSEAFVGKDRYLKRMRPHGKGKAGKLEHPRARLTVVVKEMSVEQETDLARLRVFRMRGTRMSRAQARLVPHRVLATQWSRQRRPAAASPDSPALTEASEQSRG